MNAGKWVILSIAIMAAGSSGFAIWFHRHQEAHLRQVWGIDTLDRIRNPTQVMLLQFKDDASLEPGEAPGIDSNAVAAHYDISNARGLVHVKHLLVKDYSYVWSGSLRNETPRWEFALRFVDRQDVEEVLLFSPSTRHVFCIGTEAPIDMTVVMERLDEYCQAAVAEATPAPPQ